MDPRRGGYLLVRLYAALVVAGALVVGAWFLYPSVIATPDVTGFWIAVVGFAVLVVAMLLLVQTARD